MLGRLVFKRKESARAVSRQLQSPILISADEERYDDESIGPLIQASTNTVHQQESSTLLSVTSFIIVCEFCERLAYYGLAGSLVLFFQKRMNFSNAKADTQFALWSGVCYVTPLLGGWIADAKTGRFRAIVIFCSIYCLGFFVLVAGSLPSGNFINLVMPALYLVALGTGGIKPNVSTFGAEQFDSSKPKDVQERESFFGWFYWSINLGSFVSYLVVAYVCQYGLPWLGGERWGFTAGYGIPAVSMAAAVAVFLLGRGRYRPATLRRGRQPGGGGSDLGVLLAVAGAALRRRLASALPACWRRGGRNGAGGGAEDAVEVDYPPGKVQEAYRVIQLVPFLLVQIPFWTVYSQMSTAFQNQGCQMDLNLPGGVGSIPVAALSIFDTLAIIVLVPFFNKVVYPVCKYFNLELTMLRKIGLGFAVATSAVICAGFLEIARRKASQEDGTWPIGKDSISACQDIYDFNPLNFQEYYSGQASRRPKNCWQISGCDNLNSEGVLDLACILCDNIPQAASLSVLWQSFQFLLIGTAEILTSITAMEFFYEHAPDSMKSTVSSLNLLTTALGSWLTIPLIAFANNVDSRKPWISKDLNSGSLEKYFFLLAGLMLLDFSIYAAVCRWWRRPVRGGAGGGRRPLLPGNAATTEDDDSAESSLLGDLRDLASSSGGGAGGQKYLPPSVRGGPAATGSEASGGGDGGSSAAAAAAAAAGGGWGGRAPRSRSASEAAALGVQQR